MLPKTQRGRRINDLVIGPPVILCDREFDCNSSMHSTFLESIGMVQIS